MIARSSVSRFSASRTLFLASVSLLSFALPPSLPLQAQAVQRIVSGKVMNKDNQPVHNAVVYLKDDHTLSVKSFISDDNGGYRFGQLSQATDYELWAEADGKKSGVKTISSFENKNAITLNLKIDK
jgi:hypothetical protein